MGKLINCTEAANLLGISKSQMSYWIKSNKLADLQEHIYKKGKTKFIDIFLLEELFKLYKKELPEELRQELDFAIADEEMDKVIAGKSVEVELEIYKTQAASLQDEVEALKYDLAIANEHIKSLESLLQTYYEKVGKALERNIELLEKLEPLVKDLPQDISISQTPINIIEGFVEEHTKE